MTEHAQVVDGCSCEAAIVERWQQHFNQLYDSPSDNASKVFPNKQTRISNGLLEYTVLYAGMPVITVSDVVAACHKQKRNKAPEPDSITVETIIFGSHHLHMYLCVSFIFLQLSSINFHAVSCDTLVKNKCGDLSSLNNHRACTTLMVLECIIAGLLSTDSEVDCFQFGFKAVPVPVFFKQTVEYFTRQGIHVFMCFIDFNKA